MIINRKGDKADRVCDKCGNINRNVSYWNLTRKKTHLCRSCAYKGVNKGREAHNKGVRGVPKNIGNIYTESSGYPMVWAGKIYTKHGYVPLHRLTKSYESGALVGAKQLVHHVNNNRADSRPENLYVCESMGHHRAVHSQLEDVSMDLVRRGAIVFDHATGQYKVNKNVDEFILNSMSTLSKSSKYIGECTHQPSAESLAEMIHFLYKGIDVNDKSNTD